ncbi:MAG: protoporphyrinogen oxidase HemJ [Alphaproteobacteria bacterium]|nr:protoporphyrinogen oxidase HemJ [Alphaproteobacteria bacterium]OJV46973.1 MAG: TIGR00701 family protein [Alphaproteobacteria bacterium 43-37]
MLEWLTPYYLWIKAAHIISAISWMAGLLYLPRLFVYHTQVDNESSQYQLFLTMERRLLTFIMKPAAIASYTFGIMLILTPGVWQKGVYWLHTKIFLVILLTIGHVLMHLWYKNFLHKKSTKSGLFFRVINEIPTLLMIGIVTLAVTKPF